MGRAAVSAAPKEYNLHLKLQIQHDCVGALLGEGRDAPVLDDDRPPQRPRSRTPGLEPAVPNPEQVSPHLKLHDLLRHWLRYALPAREAPDA